MGKESLRADAANDDQQTTATCPSHHSKTPRHTHATEPLERTREDQVLEGSSSQETDRNPPSSVGRPDLSAPDQPGSQPSGRIPLIPPFASTEVIDK